MLLMNKLIMRSMLIYNICLTEFQGSMLFYCSENSTQLIYVKMVSVQWMILVFVMPVLDFQKFNDRRYCLSTAWHLQGHMDHTLWTPHEPNQPHLNQQYAQTFVVKCQKPRSADTGRQRIHVGMDEMYEIVHQAMYRFFGIDEMYKLVMDEMYEIAWIWVFWYWLKFKYEYFRICIASVVRAKTLC